MSRALLAALVAVLAAPAPAAAVVKAQRAPATPPLVPRELASLTEQPYTLVQLERSARAGERAVRAAGGTVVSRSLRVWRLPSASAQRLVPRLAVAGSLTAVQPDRPLARASHLGAGDPLLAQQWWLARVGADRAEPPGPGARVIVVDSGVDQNHPEFSGRPNTTPLNAQSFLGGRREFHGTAVASLIAAPANGVGLVGVYPQVVLQSWDASRDGFLRASTVIEGIDVAGRGGPGVLNLSLGGEQREPIEEAAVQLAFARGVLVVAAVGNDRDRGSPTVFPASLPHVLTVASSSPSDEVSTFSSRSPAIDLAAPGERMPVAITRTFATPAGFGTADGTSFAAPLVSGAAAWVWTARPELDRTQVFEVLRRSARDVGQPGRDADTGFGILDIPAALAAPAPPADPLEPNDDVEHVRPGGLLSGGRPALTRPSRGRAVVSATLDRFEDPEDVYRAWVPAGHRLVVSLRSTADVDLQVWSARTRSVLAMGAERRANLLVQSSRRGTGAETARFTNRGRRGVYVYVDAFVRADTPPVDVSYTASLTTVRAPR